jgi:hypothetical protein
MAKIVHGVTVDMLPADPAPGVQLWCARCQDGSSATRGDYFWMTPGKAFRCRCGSYLQLVRERTVREPVQGEEARRG